MIAKLLFALLIAGALYLGYREIRRLPRAQRRRWWWWLGLGTLLGAALFLTATGRMHWLGAVAAAALPVLKFIAGMALRALPFLSQWRQHQANQAAAAGPASGNTSEVRTDLLRMVLDHDSGEMHGEVLQGPLAGQSLAELDDAALAQLHGDCQRDGESLALLESYLQRRFGPDWAARFDFAEHRESPPRGDGLSEAEALEILGLEAGASREDILAAHRKLMQKMHPDRGGSGYLAAKINQAKTRLLGE